MMKLSGQRTKQALPWCSQATDISVTETNHGAVHLLFIMMAMNSGAALIAAKLFPIPILKQP
jgi:hypothetical protein